MTTWLTDFFLPRKGNLGFLRCATPIWNEVRHEGNAHSVRLDAETEDWEYVMYHPSETDLRKATAAVVDEFCILDRI